jgi:hypothetical protein
MSDILKSERIHVDKQILLNDGHPFSSMEKVYAYLDELKSKLGEHMFIYDYNNLSEVLLNDESFKIFNEQIAKLNDDESNIYNFYKIIGKRVYLTEETVNTKKSKIIKYPYASCLVGLYCPHNAKNFLYSISKNKKVYYNTEYKLLSTNIKDIDSDLIKNKFKDWLSEINSDFDASKIEEINKDRHQI